MTKEIRHSRTQISGGQQITSPTVRPAPVIPHPVPEFKSRAAGLEGLHNVFASFFARASSGIESIQDAVMIGEKRRIEQENEAQKGQGAYDAMLGKDADPALANDRDYYDTYRSLLAVKTGDEASADFEKWYQEWSIANPTGDVRAARDEWAKQHLGQFDDATFGAETMSTFYKSTQRRIDLHEENAVRIQLNMGLETLGSAIDAEAKNGTMTPDRVTYYIEAARKLDALNPHEAAPRVAAALATAAMNHPERALEIVKVLSEPGTGRDGKSFSESFPDAYNDLQIKATEAWVQTHKLEQVQMISSLRERVLRIDKLSPDEYAKLLADYQAARMTGASSALDDIADNIAREFDRRAEVETRVDQTSFMLAGSAPLDPEVLRKGIPDYLAKAGVTNIIAAAGGDEDSAAFIADTFVRAGDVQSLPSEYRVQLSSALLSAQDPASQVAAMRILQGMSAARSREFAATFLTEEAAVFFNAAIVEQERTNLPIEQAVANLNRIREEGTKLNSKVTIATVVGDSAGEESAKVTWSTAIKDSVTAAFGQPGFLGTSIGGTSITLPYDVEEAISEYALQVARVRGGEITWQEAIDEAVKATITRGEVLPTDQGYTLRYDKKDQPVWTDAQGVTRPRIKMGFNVYNPTTGKVVNTVRVYEEQLDEVRATNGWVFSGGGTDGVSLRQDSEASQAGAYTVFQDGSPIVFRDGANVVWEVKTPAKYVPQIDPLTGQEIIEARPDPLTGPAPLESSLKSAKLSEETIADMHMPEGFVMLRFTFANGDKGWKLAYRPNYGDEAGKTLQERADEVDSLIDTNP